MPSGKLCSGQGSLRSASSRRGAREASRFPHIERNNQGLRGNYHVSATNLEVNGCSASWVWERCAFLFPCAPKASAIGHLIFLGLNLSLLQKS